MNRLTSNFVGSAFYVAIFFKQRPFSGRDGKMVSDVFSFNPT